MDDRRWQRAMESLLWSRKITIYGDWEAVWGLAPLRYGFRVVNDHMRFWDSKVVVPSKAENVEIPTCSVIFAQWVIGDVNYCGIVDRRPIFNALVEELGVAITHGRVVIR